MPHTRVGLLPIVATSRNASHMMCCKLEVTFMGFNKCCYADDHPTQWLVGRSSPCLPGDGDEFDTLPESV